MKNLIKITESKIDKDLIQTVSARDLWEKLEINRQFADWIKDQLSLFVENQDYVLISPVCEIKKRGGDRKSIEYYLTLTCAEHIALMSRTPKGKEIRQYFIDIEKKYREGKISYKQIRDKSKEVRRKFTDTLKERGYTKQHEYIQTSMQMKKALDITAKKDKMSELELKKITASELIAEINIENLNISGYYEVNPVCVKSCQLVSNATNKLLLN